MAFATSLVLPNTKALQIAIGSMAAMAHSFACLRLLRVTEEGQGQQQRTQEKNGRQEGQEPQERRQVEEPREGQGRQERSEEGQGEQARVRLRGGGAAAADRKRTVARGRRDSAPDDVRRRGFVAV